MSSKDRFLLAILLFCILNSCKQDFEGKENIIHRNNYLKNNFLNYKLVYENANDSILAWKKKSLSVVKSYIIYPNRLDSVLVFNKDSTRLYTSINTIDGKNLNAIFDYVDDFGGAKINGKWYFFIMGVYRPVRREDWQDSVYAPLSFEELSYVAYNTLFKTLVKNINEGHPEKNEEIFNNRIFSELRQCKGLNGSAKRMCEDSLILDAVFGKYQHKLDPNEIASIKESISASKLPEGVPLVKSYSWWEIYKYGQKPFETKAWKDYVKQKYGKE